MAKATKKANTKRSKTSSKKVPNYPRHSIEKALQIPRGILEQNAGRECTDQQSASYLNVKYNKGPYLVKLNSTIKFSLLERPEAGKVKLTSIARKILKPQKKGDELSGLQEAVLKAPVISEIYSHYRGENLPDEEFFDNALTDNFKIPDDKLSEFKSIFFESLKKAELLSEHDGKFRVIDVSAEKISGQEKAQENLNKLKKAAKSSSGDTCFVMMPFSNPLGSYYEKIYKPAIEKAGLTPVRADTEIFGTGKIMDQIWSGINAAKVLVAELTTRNPNVFYELGLAHALQKPVVLVSLNEEDVPFDLHHIRVIYYEVADPFWGNKLIDKIAENVLSAIKNPEEAILKSSSE